MSDVCMITPDEAGGKGSEALRARLPRMGGRPVCIFLWKCGRTTPSLFS